MGKDAQIKNWSNADVNQSWLAIILIIMHCLLHSAGDHAKSSYQHIPASGIQLMADVNLLTYSLKDLQQLKKDVAKAISTFEERQKVDARAKVEAMARDMGFSLNELVKLTGKAKRTPAAPKYRHPENPDVTWSGRGRRPAWFQDALDQGATEEDMTIA